MEGKNSIYVYNFLLFAIIVFLYRIKLNITGHTEDMGHTWGMGNAQDQFVTWVIAFAFKILWGHYLVCTEGTRILKGAVPYSWSSGFPSVLCHLEDHYNDSWWTEYPFVALGSSQSWSPRLFLQ